MDAASRALLGVAFETRSEPEQLDLLKVGFRALDEEDQGGFLNVVLKATSEPERRALLTTAFECLSEPSQRALMDAVLKANEPAAEDGRSARAERLIDLFIGSPGTLPPDGRNTPAFWDAYRALPERDRETFDNASLAALRTFMEYAEADEPPDDISAAEVEE
jgi:hypothetical protein